MPHHLSNHPRQLSFLCFVICVNVFVGVVLVEGRLGGGSSAPRNVLNVKQQLRGGENSFQNAAVQPKGERALHDEHYLVGLGGEPEADLLPLQLCQGDCDEDTDCYGDLICFQRVAYDPVPGCIGGEEYDSDTDFCVEPDAVIVYANATNVTEVPTFYPTISPTETSAPTTDMPTAAPSPDMPYYSDGSMANTTEIHIVGNNNEITGLLQLCEGDCDDDEDCAPGLICYQREPDEPIPGCLGDDSSRNDYCILPLSVQGGGEPTTAPAPTLEATVATPSPTDASVSSTTPEPTTKPTDEEVPPTGSPTSSPTTIPTEAPAVAPTETPTGVPTVPPTGLPTVSPTASPTTSPTGSPTTVSPTAAPTICPSVSPSASPSASPTDAPTTLSPTQSPTEAPTTATPTEAPTTLNPTTAMPTPAPTLGVPTPKPYLELVGNNGELTAPLQNCQADCDTNDDCEEGLICFQRRGNENVPGCIITTETYPGQDFCVNPEAIGAPTTPSTPPPVGPPTLSPSEASGAVTTGGATITDPAPTEPPTLPPTRASAVTTGGATITEPSPTEPPTMPPTEASAVTTGGATITEPSPTESPTVASAVTTGGATVTEPSSPTESPGVTSGGAVITQPSATPIVEETTGPTQAGGVTSGGAVVTQPSTIPADDETLSPSEAPIVLTTPIADAATAQPDTTSPTMSPVVSLLTPSSVEPFPLPFIVDEELPPLQLVSNNNITPLGECEGDCDTDNDCEEGLICFLRFSREEVPGCDGAGVYGADYCIKDPTTVDAAGPTALPLASPAPTTSPATASPSAMATAAETVVASEVQTAITSMETSSAGTAADTTTRRGRLP